MPSGLLAADIVAIVTMGERSDERDREEHDHRSDHKKVWDGDEDETPVQIGRR
jgi:hypothetical protein